MMNNWAQMVNDQSRLLGFVDWKQWQKSIFCKRNGPGKVCKKIHQDFKIDIHKVFLEENIVV